MPLRPSRTGHWYFATPLQMNAFYLFKNSCSIHRVLKEWSRCTRDGVNMEPVLTFSL